MRKLLASQAVPLPENILKLKWAGDFEGAIRAIDSRLAGLLPELLRDRLTIEREILSRLPRQYPFTKAEALARIVGAIPDFTEAEFDRLETAGGLDFIFIGGGEKRYFESVVPMLFEWDRDYLARAGRAVTSARPIIDDAIAELKQRGTLAYRISIEVRLKIKDAAFVPGETYRVHLPIPKPCLQQSSIEITAAEDAYIAPESAPQRTVFFERKLQENEPFTVSYSYDSRINYVDLSSGKAHCLPLYGGAEPPCESDLAEIRPHMTFTPLVRSIAMEIADGKADKLQIARAAYDYVTTRVTYSFLRDYLLVDNVSEYVALSGKGDCGAQTLLFMALCRLNGIPCRWQSGTTARPDSFGSHDWCEFYVEPYGWTLCDVSFGGGAKAAGSESRWSFFFGNLDPYRMIANTEYMRELDPPRVNLRCDPYDNQSGECETLTRNLEYSEHETERAIISLVKIEC